MLRTEKQEILAQILTLLSQLIDEDDNTKSDSFKKYSERAIEMLTIKECAATVKGMLEHTIRKLVLQNKIPYIRSGEGKNGKILISKSALFSYLESIRHNKQSSPL